MPPAFSGKLYVAYVAAARPSIRQLLYSPANTILGDWLYTPCARAFSRNLAASTSIVG
jgi:hypothetical protein